MRVTTLERDHRRTLAVWPFVLRVCERWPDGEEVELLQEDPFPFDLKVRFRTGPRKNKTELLDVKFSDFGDISAVGWTRALLRSGPWTLWRHVNEVARGYVPDGAEADFYGHLQLQEGVIPRGRGYYEGGRLAVARLQEFPPEELLGRRRDYRPKPCATYRPLGKITGGKNNWRKK